MINIKDAENRPPENQPSCKSSKEEGPLFLNLMLGHLVGLVLFCVSVVIGIELIYPASPIGYRGYCILLAVVGLGGFYRFDPMRKYWEYYGLLALGMFYVFHLALNIFQYVNPLLLGIFVGVAGLVHHLFRHDLNFHLKVFNGMFLLVGVLVLFVMITYPDRLLFQPGTI